MPRECGGRASRWIVLLSAATFGCIGCTTPRVVVISLDGARADLVERFIDEGVIDRDTGLARLAARGVVARQNITTTPSVTAVAHIAIATGSSAVRNDIPANAFHPIVATIGTNISGFAAPIGGYHWHGPGVAGPSIAPTAIPIWEQLRAADKTVVTATWPGSDGLDILLAGTIVQSAARRMSHYTVPFGAFGGIGARGFELAATDFVIDSDLQQRMAAAGRASYSPIRVTSVPVETIYCSIGASSACSTTAFPSSIEYRIHVAVLDSSDDATTNYDTLVFFDANRPLGLAPLALPSTGPAQAKLGGPSARFHFEQSGAKAGTAFFASHIAPDLASVRFARYTASFIPRNAAVLADVDDINERVGFWAPQPDFRIPERLSPGFDSFPDAELEAMYLDQVRTFTDYQTRVALRALSRNPRADLAMIYLEQPDGSGHQFMLTDPRQPTDFRDNRSIGAPDDPPGAIGQERGKRARYDAYVKFAYREANAAVQRILEAVGTDEHGGPAADVFVVSDHGMAPFHTAVNLRNLLLAGGIDVSALAIRTTGPAANIYVNLAGREAVSGTQVTREQYPALVERIAQVLRATVDRNAYYNPDAHPVFSHVWQRPVGCADIGRCTSASVGQNFGDVFALMAEGYNFDGMQTPIVGRLGDGPPNPATTSFSVPNFYGAHGYDAQLRSMSAILYAAGPSLKQGRTIETVSNLDIAPTVMAILGVTPAQTVEGRIIPGILRTDGD